jgi:hypothetical protein
MKKIDSSLEKEIINFYDINSCTLEEIAYLFKLERHIISKILNKYCIVRKKMIRRRSKLLKSKSRICKICLEEKDINHFNKQGSWQCFHCLHERRKLKSKNIQVPVMKICNNCNIYHSINNFYKGTGLDGYRGYCKNCCRIKYRNKQKAYNDSKKNCQKSKKKLNKSLKAKRDKNLNYRLKIQLRNRFYQALKKAQKSTSVLNLVGCSLEELINHIESQFTKGMSWDKWGNGEGKFNIDHIKPCCSFDLSIPEQQKECFHYSNLRPLWWEENLIKLQNDRKLSISKKI